MSDFKVNEQPISKYVEHFGIADADYPYEVTEIFPTICGEGSLTGRPAIFVRLAGCNLQCPLCDTEYPTNRTMTAGEIIEEIWSIQQSYANGGPSHIHRVVVTGGEPFRQNLVPLFNKLNEMQSILTMSIESNGTYIKKLLEFYRNTFGCRLYVNITVSPKSKIELLHLAKAMSEDYSTHVNPIEELKLVVGAAPGTNPSSILDKDCRYLGDKNWLTKLPEGEEQIIWKCLKRNPGMVWLQPLMEQDGFVSPATWEFLKQLSLQHGYKISFQGHKLANWK